jgi:hypothetical protein
MGVLVSAERKVTVITAGGIFQSFASAVTETSPVMGSRKEAIPDALEEDVHTSVPAETVTLA